MKLIPPPAPLVAVLPEMVLSLIVAVPAEVLTIPAPLPVLAVLPEMVLLVTLSVPLL